MAFSPVGGEFQANTTTVGSQVWSAVAADADGDYVVTWESEGQDGDQGGIFAQRFSRDGTPVGDEFRVNTTTAGDQSEPAVAMAPDGRFVIAWEMYDGGGAFARRYDAAGNPLGDEFRVTTSRTGNGMTVDAAMSDSGAFAVTWEGVGLNSFDRGIFVRRYDASGTPLTASAESVHFDDLTKTGSSIAMNDAGVVVVWTQYVSGTLVTDVFGRRYDTAAGTWGPVFTVNGDPGYAQAQAVVRMRNDGSFVAAWIGEAGQDGSGDGIYSRRFAADATPLGDDRRVNYITAGSQRSPALAVSDAGGYVIAWHGPPVGSSEADIYYQVFNAAGADTGGDLRANTTTAGNQFVPAAAISRDGSRAVITWHSLNQDGDGQGVFGRRFVETTGLLAVRAFNDANGDGLHQQNEESLLAGRTVYVDLDRDGVQDPAEVSGVTSATGPLDLPLTPGTYWVRQVVPAGWEQTAPAPGEPIVATVVSGGVTSVQFGTRPIANTLSGTAFRDLDTDGVFDTNEPVLAGRTIYLDTNRDEAFQDDEPTTVTDAAGNYVFSNLAPGDYRVGQILPQGWYQTTPARGTNFRTTLAPGGANAYLHFGSSNQLFTIRGSVYDDANGNGVRDAGESLFVRDRFVYIDTNENGRFDDGERNVTTIVDGFSFPNLLPGTYRLRQVVPAGYRQTDPGPDATSHIVTVGGGNPNPLVYFGNTPAVPAIVGRHVLYDNSAYDNFTFGPSPFDDAAIAPDKRALLPGGSPSFNNVSTYSRGINAIAIDVANLPMTAVVGLAQNVRIKVGTGGEPATWADGPRPHLFGARGGDGVNGSDRIVLYWADGALRNTWVQVTLPALPQTEFNTPDVFYFANLVGETGDPGASFIRVNALDLAAVKRALNTNSVITFRNDFNRDGRVNALDMAAVRGNLGNTLPGITPPPAAIAALSGPSDEQPVWDMG